MAFRCMVCGELFNDEDEAISHSVRNHPERIYIVVENSQWSFQRLKSQTQTNVGRGSSKFSVKRILSIVASILT